MSQILGNYAPLNPNPEFVIEIDHYFYKFISLKDYCYQLC